MRGAIARVERFMCCLVGIGLLVSLARRARPSESLQMYADRAGSDCDPEHIEKYRTSWLADNAAGVTATFIDDSVLMPQGSTLAVGREAIRKYWWPASSPKTTITKLNITYEEIGGECGTAYAEDEAR